MNCFIKSKTDFRTKEMKTVSAYSAYLASIYDDSTNIVFAGDTAAVKGDFVFCENGFFGIVEDISIDEDQIDLICKNALNIFDRDMFFSGSVTNIEGFIKTSIETYFRDTTDAQYAMPYLSVTAGTSTAGTTKPDIDDDGIWNLKAYIGKARRVHNIFVTFSISGNTLNVTIEKKDDSIKNIDFSAGDFELMDETYSSDQIGKITTKCIETSAVQDWYILDDGTITNTYQSTNRIDGRWIAFAVDDAADVADAVKDEFAQSSHSHLIEFKTAKVFDFYQSVRIRIKNRVFYSYISSIIDSDGEITYQTGELRTKYTQQREMI